MSSRISIFPDSIREISRISLMMDSRFLPAELMTPEYPQISLNAARISSGLSGSRSQDCRLSHMMISFIPSTALIGVRISWLMAARNSLLAALERSAISRASRSLLFSAARWLE